MHWEKIFSLPFRVHANVTQKNSFITHAFKVFLLIWFKILPMLQVQQLMVEKVFFSNHFEFFYSV